PLHERDTSVAIKGSSQRRHYYALFQSPSRGGHLRGGSGAGGGRGGDLFQSPSRGGHLRGGDSTRPHGSSSGFSPLHEGDTSVARGLWPRVGAELPFQSPSRGGHLRGTGISPQRAERCFSPLHEGDTSVAVLRESRETRPT